MHKANKGMQNILPGWLPNEVSERLPGSPLSHSGYQLSQTHQHWTRVSSSPMMLLLDRLEAWTPEEAKEKHVRKR